jgi:hypothetical protein
VAIAAGGGLSKPDDASPETGPATINAGQGGIPEFVSWGAVASLALTDNAYNYIYYDRNTDSILATTDFYSISFTQDFTLGRAYRSGTDVVVRLCGTNMWNFNRRVQLFGEEVFPVIRANGMLVSEAGTRNLVVTGGVLWAELVNRFSTTGIDTSAADTFTAWYGNTGVGFTSVPSQTTVSNTQYFNGTVLANITNNRYGVHYVYVVHDSTVHVVYGELNTTDLGIAEADQPPADIPGLLASYGTLVAKIIVQQGTANFIEVQSAFETVFTGSGTVDHNSTTGLQGGTTNEYYHLTSSEYSSLQAMIPGTGTLTDGAAVAFDLSSKLDNRYFLSTAQTAITLTLSNVADYTVSNLLVKKTIAGDCTISLAGTGLTFRGPNGADLGTTPDIVLSGATDARWEISFANYGDTESTNKVIVVSVLEELT